MVGWHKNTGIRTFAVVLTTILTGCVSKSDYDVLDSQHQSLRSNYDQDQEQLKQLKAENALLEDRLSTISQQNEKLRQTNQVLINKNGLLSEDILNLRQQSLDGRKEIRKEQAKMEYASKTYEDLLQSLKKEVADKQMAIDRLQEKVRITFIDQILFPSGQIEISEKGKDALDKLLPTLKKVKEGRILVEGHSDSSPVQASLQSTYPSNWEISARRSTSVVRYLESKGVDSKLLVAASRSHFVPVASNKSSEGRQKNRRIEIIVIPKIDASSTDAPNQ